MFLKFLSTSDSIKHVLEEPALERVFEVCCDIVSQKLESEIKSLKLQDSYKEIEINELEEASYDFVRSFFRKSMIEIFKIHSKIASAEEKDQKKKLSLLREQVDKNMKIFTTIYNKIADTAQGLQRIATQTVKRVLKEALELHGKENTDKEKPSKKAKKQYIAFQDKLFEVAYVSNKFLDYIHICICSLASEKEHKMTRYLNNLCRKSIDLLQDMGEF